VTYLLDANALIALGVTTHESHERVDAWIATLDSPADRLATCAVTELAFVRIAPQLPGLGASVAQAKELLRRLKRQQRVHVQMLADAVGADHLPGWVKTVRQTTQRRVERVRANINDTPFVDAVVEAFRSIMPKLQRRA